MCLQVTLCSLARRFCVRPLSWVHLFAMTCEQPISTAWLRETHCPPRPLSIRKLLNAPLKGEAMASWYPPELRHNVHGYEVSNPTPPKHTHTHSTHTQHTHTHTHTHTMLTVTRSLTPRSEPLNPTLLTLIFHSPEVRQLSKHCHRHHTHTQGRACGWPGPALNPVCYGTPHPDT